MYYEYFFKSVSCIFILMISFKEPKISIFIHFNNFIFTFYVVFLKNIFPRRWSFLSPTSLPLSLALLLHCVPFWVDILGYAMLTFSPTPSWIFQYPEIKKSSLQWSYLSITAKIKDHVIYFAWFLTLSCVIYLHFILS